MKRMALILIFAMSLLLQSCGGCTRDGRRVNQERASDDRSRATASRSVRTEKDANDRDSREERRGGSKTVQMSKKGGVFIVPIEVNGVPMEFIFDTGASDICISLTEARYLLKSGKLSQDDILGVASYQIADGSIVEGTKIILREVRIGNKTLRNVEASIIHNLSAPLLLGQSALARFGKISIDYNRNQIEFD